MGRSNEIVKMAVEEIKTILTTDRIIGSPIQIGEATILPLVSVGFGFGGGGGSDDTASGSGEGAGAGGGVKPVALVISDQSGVRVEPVRATGASLVASITDIVKMAMEKEKGNGKTGNKAGDTPNE